MTGNNVLLDTNIIIEVFDGNKAIADKIAGLEGFYISVVVLGELYVGVHRVSNKSKHLKKLQSFLELCTVVNIDDTTAEYFGEIMAALYKKGKPIPTNDVWIAATAKQYGFDLISQDKHFNEIENLTTVFW